MKKLAMSMTEYRAAQQALRDTGCTHSCCPARVVYGGRCKSTCPRWPICKGGAGFDCFDHVHLRTDENGNRQFASAHHGMPTYLTDGSLDAFCEHHHLTYDVVKTSFKGVPNATVVIFHKAK